MDPRHNSSKSLASTDLTDEERRELKGFEFFGYELRDKSDTPDNEKALSFVPPTEENESAYITAAGGAYGQVLDVRGDNFSNDRDLIVKYRNAAMQPEVDQAIEDIVNEAIVSNDTDLPVTLNLDFTDLSDAMKQKLVDEFNNVLMMLDFRKYGHDIFRRWYIDGRLAYHIVIDLNNPQRGIIDLRPINPIKIRKIKEVLEDIDARTGSKMITGTEEYFVYSEDGFAQGNSATMSAGQSETANTGLKLPKDTVAYVTSGILDTQRRSSLSYIHKALRNVNQLRMMEDALVIYRLARAPERRLFYIDTGDMPRAQAQRYISSLMQKYRNKISYDANTGELKDNRRHMHMLEDFWLPRTSTGRGTEVSNLPGGQNLGEIEDILYFQKKLYQALCVPISRLDPEIGFHIGRTAEINRDEVRFQKFVDRLRLRFAELFKQLLRVQLVLRGIMKENEWDGIKEFVSIDYSRDSFFSELKESEIFRERIDTLAAAEPYVGKYFSREYCRKRILQQSEEEIKEIKHQIRSEALNKDGLPSPSETVDGDGEGGGASGDIGDFNGDLGLGTEGGEDIEAPLGDPEGASTALGPDDDNEDLDLPSDDDEEL